MQLEMRHNSSTVKHAGKDMSMLTSAHILRRNRQKMPSNVKGEEGKDTVNKTNDSVQPKEVLEMSGSKGAESSSKRGGSTLLQNAAKKIKKLSLFTKPKPEVHAKGCTRTEADMIFISTVLSGPKHEYNTKRSLSRFQFTDSLLQIADVKFVKTKVCRNIVEAFEKLLKDINCFADCGNSLKFRAEYLLVETIDDALRARLDTLAKVYKVNSGAENIPSEKKTMSFNEWMGLWQSSDVERRYPWITERAKSLAFCRSKAPCLNQFSLENSFKRMTFCEFLEGVVRVTHNVLLISNIDDNGDFIYRNANGISVDDVANELEEVVNILQTTLTKKQLEDMELKNRVKEKVSKPPGVVSKGGGESRRSSTSKMTGNSSKAKLVVANVDKKAVTNGKGRGNRRASTGF